MHESSSHLPLPRVQHLYAVRIGPAKPNLPEATMLQPLGQCISALQLCQSLIFAQGNIGAAAELQTWLDTNWQMQMSTSARWDLCMMLCYALMTAKCVAEMQLTVGLTHLHV